MELSSGEQKLFLEFISIHQLADILSELDGDNQRKVIDMISPHTGTLVITQMNNDDLIEMLSNLGEKKATELLSDTDEEFSQDIETLMEYPPETAGRIMNNQMVWINKSYSVREAVTS